MATVVLIVLVGYVLISGFIFWPIVRRPLISWYLGNAFFIHGSGPVDILLKQVGFRLGFEVFIFGLACLFGSLGGWIYVIMKAKKEADAEGHE